MRLTLLVAVRNEGARMRGFLERHAPYFDEVVVVHDGECTDDTLAIAREYPNVTAYQRPGRHNPFPQREWALREAIREGWVAVFDPDSAMSDELLADLRPLVEETDVAGFDGLAVTMLRYLDDTFIDEHLQWRIFKHSDRVHYPEHPHAGIEGLRCGRAAPYTFRHVARAADLPGKRRRRNAHLRRLLREQPDSPRAVAWRAGIAVYDDLRPLLESKGIAWEVEGRPLAKLKGLGKALADRFAEELGIETLDELAGGDAEYMAGELGLPVARVRRLQDLARRAG